MPHSAQPKSAYAIFINTLCSGPVPAWRDEDGLPLTYATEREAQLEIVDDLQERLRQFVAGERPFEDATTIEDFILPVDVWPDGSISTEDGTVPANHTSHASRIRHTQSKDSDPAAVFAIATSLWAECHRQFTGETLGDHYAGLDGLMREVMRIAETFETWAVQNVLFNELSGIWPYLLQDRFGVVCLLVAELADLTRINHEHCALIAARLDLPVRRRPQTRL